EAAQVALAEDVACHYLPGCVHAGQWGARAIEHPRLPVDGHAQVGEGDAWPQRIRAEGRPVDRQRPVALAGVHGRTRADSVQPRWIVAGAARSVAVVLIDGRLEL